MDLIVYQMMQLEVIHITNGYTVIEGFTGASVIQNGLAIRVQTGLGKGITDILLVGAIEYRSHHLPAQSGSGTAQMHFQYLTDVHSGRYAQGVQTDVQRTSIRQIGHILLRHDAGYYPCYHDGPPSYRPPAAYASERCSSVPPC